MMDAVLWKNHKNVKYAFFGFVETLNQTSKKGDTAETVFHGYRNGGVCRVQRTGQARRKYSTEYFRDVTKEHEKIVIRQFS